MKVSIAENIRLIREAKGYSQEFVAKKMIVTQQAYSAMEKNPDNMSLKRLKELCLVLDVNLVTLLGEDINFVQQNYNQQGGNTATQIVLQSLTNGEKELYERLIIELKEEINYLRKSQ
jgi:transcriptional regulator with XRE-family HTH domain